jgi:F-type H+-transporting ATPase subunit epsilon
MAKLSVEITTPEKRVLQTQAEEVICPGFEGLFGVRPGHTPFLSLMEPGPVTLRDGSSTQTYFVAGGFVEVSRDKVSVLADQAEPANAIDVGASQKRLTEAQAKLTQLSSADSEFATEAAAVRRETARMAVASRHR